MVFDCSPAAEWVAALRASPGSSSLEKEAAMKRLTIIAAALGIALASLGCAEMAAKRVLHEAAGASAKVVSRATTPNLAGIDGLKVGKIRNEAEQLCPPEFLSALRTELAAAAKESKSLARSASPATVDADVVHYESPDTLGAAVSPETTGVVLVTLTGPDGKLLGKLTVTGKSKAARTSPADMAKVMAKKLVAYLQERKTAG